MKKVAVIGPGAMGLLYGAKLSKAADVVLVGNNEEHIREIRENGVVIRRGEEETHYPVTAVLNGEAHQPADLVILFTKAYLTAQALEANRDLIGKDTWLLTLQNGAGHEEALGGYADAGHVLIGTTAQGSYREDAHTIVNSGLGDTVIGCPAGTAAEEELQGIRDLFAQAGFPCEISSSITQTVWNKLMINASSSVLSGVLQTAQGYVAEDAYAWAICRDLITELCAVANRSGAHFDTEEQIERIRTHLQNAPGGYTSIYADLKNGRKTEADYISGAVVRAAGKAGVPVPTHQLMVRLVHAMENRRISAV